MKAGQCLPEQSCYICRKCAGAAVALAEVLPLRQQLQNENPVFGIVGVALGNQRRQAAKIRVFPAPPVEFCLGFKGGLVRRLPPSYLLHQITGMTPAIHLKGMIAAGKIGHFEVAVHHRFGGGVASLEEIVDDVRRSENHADTSTWRTLQRAGVGFSPHKPTLSPALSPASPQQTPSGRQGPGGAVPLQRSKNNPATRGAHTGGKDQLPKLALSVLRLYGFGFGFGFGFGLGFRFLSVSFFSFLQPPVQEVSQGLSQTCN